MDRKLPPEPEKKFCPTGRRLCFTLADEPRDSCDNDEGDARIRLACLRGTAAIAAFLRRHCEHSRTFAVVLANLRGSQ